jgi:uncharacterized membrane protein
MMNGYDMNGWGWLAMTLMVLVPVAIAGVLIWAAAQRPRRNPLSAREELAARLARGEIATQEYRERLEALSDRRPVG